MKTFVLLLTLALLVLFPVACAANSAAPSRIETQPGPERTDDLSIGATDDDDNSVSFAGTWETISDGQYSIPLTIVQTGNKVTGLYPGNNGKIEGTVTGKVLLFKWESDGGSGSGRFVMDESQQAFSGTYNRGDNPDEVEATWNGNRPAGKGGKGSPVSFAGDWKIQSTFTWTFSLVQTGAKVTGEGRAANLADPVYLREGIVVGNKLTFKITTSISPVSSGELVMDEGGKSFKGQLLGRRVTGTLIPSPKQ
jgi:hypothetical protein